MFTLLAGTTTAALNMEVQTSNVEFYNKMEELQEKLKKSEEERMLLQRQFDLLLQANQEKERARVSAIEARYKRFLDEDKRRRDRNSSLLQAMDRIDSHTANLAAKTERMRMLRRHYEAFIAHAYPSWHLQMERSYYPMAPLPSTSGLLGTDFSGYSPDLLRAQDCTDYSETRYLDLPVQRRCPLTTPLSRSELSIASRDECPIIVGRPQYRNGSSIRSKSLSPTRIRGTSARYETNSVLSPRNFPSYSLSQVYDTELSPRIRHESMISRTYETNQSPRSPRFQSNMLSIQNPDSYLHSPKTSFNGQHSLDYEHGNSDIDIDQNTSGDLLNFSNLSISDDGALDADISDSHLSDAPRKSYSSPRDVLNAKRSKYNTLPSSQVSPRSSFSPRESYISRASEKYSPASLLDYDSKPALSPRNRRTGIPTSLSISDSVHRILLSPQDIETRRSDFSVSPREYKPTWQMHRPNYLQPSRAVRRSVTFTEPEYGVTDTGKYPWRDNDPDTYFGSLSRIRRNSPSVTPAEWELSEHEKYLREKQGREKGAFQEKIQRLKDLIQENKDQETGINRNIEEIKSTSPRKLKHKDKEDQKPKWEDMERKNGEVVSHNQFNKALEKNVKSRRSSLVKDSAMPYGSTSKLLTSQLPSKLELEEYDVHNLEGNGAEKEDISDKEQLSGQFMEKDEDVKEHSSKPTGIENIGKEHPTLENKEEILSNVRKYPGDMGKSRAYSFEKQKTDTFEDEHKLSFDLSHPEEQNIQPSDNADQKPIPRDNNGDYSYLQDPTEKNGYQLNTHSLPLQDDVTNYLQQSRAEQKLENGFKQGQEPILLNYDLKDGQQPGQEERIAYNLQQDQDQDPLYSSKPHQAEGADYSYTQDPLTQPHQAEGADYSYTQDQFNYDPNPESRKQDTNYQYDNSPQNPQREEQISQNQNVSYRQEAPGLEYSHPNSGDYSSVSQPDNTYDQGDTFESYQAESHPEQQPSSYEAYQQSPVQKELSDVGGYESYHEDGQKKAQSPETYQGYTTNSDQYSPEYQNYSQDQYNQQDSQGYATTPAKDNYQFEDNANNAQYQYEGQDYNYQENPSGFTYQDNQSYPQNQQYTDQVSYKDQQFPSDSQYQDQNYLQDSNYVQEQLYQPSSDYEDQKQRQDQNYQQEEQYKDNMYQESQQYDSYNKSQPGPDDFSESTSESYQPSYPEGKTFDSQKMADPSSEPAYSEASEIENQMAAVVGIGPTSTDKIQDSTPSPAAASAPTPTPTPAPTTPTPTPTPAPTTPTPTPTPAPTTPTPASSSARGKAAAKKKPQLTRKQSSISSDSSDSKLQATAPAPSLSRMSESPSESARTSK